MIASEAVVDEQRNDSVFFSIGFVLFNYIVSSFSIKYFFYYFQRSPSDNNLATIDFGDVEVYSKYVVCHLIFERSETISN